MRTVELCTLPTITPADLATDERPTSVTVVLFRHDESGIAVKKSVNTQTRKQLGASLMRAALAQETKTDAWRWSIESRPSGQPMIASGPDIASHMNVSLSHSGPLFAAAASSCDALGVDVEIVRKRRFREIAEYLNWPSSTWDSSGQISPNRFFQLWTLWEATIKAAASGADHITQQLFTRLVENTSSGQPSSLTLDQWSTRSWMWADHSWVTVVARLHTAPRIHLYELISSPLNDRDLDFRRLENPSNSLPLSPKRAAPRAVS
jgi:phosphopantetheinyl transferase